MPRAAMKRHGIRTDRRADRSSLASAERMQLRHSERRIARYRQGKRLMSERRRAAGAAFQRRCIEEATSAIFGAARPPTLSGAANRHQIRSPTPIAALPVARSERRNQRLHISLRPRRAVARSAVRCLGQADLAVGDILDQRGAPIQDKAASRVDQRADSATARRPVFFFFFFFLGFLFCCGSDVRHKPKTRCGLQRQRQAFPHPPPARLWRPNDSITACKNSSVLPTSDRRNTARSVAKHARLAGRGG